MDSLQVLPALAKVDEIYQAAVALFYLEDYAYKDIAVILDVPVGTVKSRIARGIAQLREILLSDEFACFNSPQCGYAEWGFSPSARLEPGSAVGLTFVSQSRLTAALTQK